LTESVDRALAQAQGVDKFYCTLRCNRRKRSPAMSYQSEVNAAAAAITGKAGWESISAESVARMRLQNRFKTGLDIAKYTAAIMRRDMAAYDADPAKYTQSLGCWHGFIGQQKLISIKKHFGSTERRYLYLSGWMVAALRSEFGPLPDQSMHEKTSVPALIEELYTFLRQADARELGGLFRELDAARAAGDNVKAQAVQNQIDNFQTHVVPIIADIDAGFGNAEATYLLAKKMIEAGACALQIENQVSDEKQCGQDPRHPLRLPGAGRGGRHHRRPHRQPGRRPDQADRLQPRAG
jgi:isocitrate lyase